MSEYWHVCRSKCNGDFGEFGGDFAKFSSVCFGLWGSCGLAASLCVQFSSGTAHHGTVKRASKVKFKLHTHVA